jgi:hypothetical protein
VLPSALWRDVLPTRAHRWVMERSEAARTLDCTPLDPESASVAWLSRSQIALMADGASDCSEPHLADRLAAEHYTYLLVRRDNRTGRAFFDQPVPPGLRLAARFRDAQVFAVVEPAPPIYTSAMSGFWPREYEAGRSWRWMRDRPVWTIANTGGTPAATSLDLELSAFAVPRNLTLEIDGRAMTSLVVAVERRVYHVTGLTLAPGVHELAFLVDPPGTASTSRDPRALSCALGAWTWTAVGARP